MKSGCLNNFTCSVKTDNAGTSTSTQFTFPTNSGGTYNCIVSWGDGNSSVITTYNDAAWTHTYSIAGTYTIIVSGIFKGLQFNGVGDCLKLLNISRWGNFVPLGVQGQFSGCANLTVTAKDNLYFPSGLYTQFFQNCSSLTSVPSFNTWNMTLVTSVGNFFTNCVLFNQTINIRITVAVTLGNFFNGCSSLNSPITIDAPLANNYGGTFRNCLALNSNIVLNGIPTTCNLMFSGCLVFNKSVANLGNLSLCTIFTSMFQGCTVFDQDVSMFNIASVTVATSMMLSSGFSITNYDKLLDATTGWPSQATIQSGVVFSAGTAHYSAGSPTTGRLLLTSTKLWSITDGGSP